MPDKAKLKSTGVRAELLTDIHGKDIHGQDVSFLKNSTVLVEPLDWNESQEGARYRITTYTHNTHTAREDMPESKTAIHIGNQGIFTADPKETFRFIEYFEVVKTPIFPDKNSPHVDEIAQGSIGDCTLLATIQSILLNPNGPDFIRSMMKDNGDGTTTVRFYDPITLEYDYIRVENLILHNEDGPVSRHKAPWVHILESAFAARGFNRDNKKTISASCAAIYSNGLLHEFVHHSLVGLKAEDIRTPTKTLDKTLRTLEANITELSHLIIQSREFIEFDLMSTFYQSMAMAINDDDIEEIRAIFPELTIEELKERLVTHYFLQALSTYPKKIEEYAQQIKECKEKYDLSNIQLRIKEYHEHDKSIFRAYTDSENHFYEHIKKKISDGAIVTASCSTNLPHSTSGLVGNHAYSVAGVYKKSVKTPDNKTFEMCFVRLRNPWGQVGRHYYQHVRQLDIKVLPTEDGIFSVELKDFCRHFSKITLSDLDQNLHHTIMSKLKMPVKVDREYAFADLLYEHDLIIELQENIASLEALSCDHNDATEEINSYKEALQKRQAILDIYLCHEGNQLFQIINTAKQLQQKINALTKEKIDVHEIIEMQVCLSQARVKQLFLAKMSLTHFSRYKDQIADADKEISSIEGWLQTTTKTNKTLSECCDGLNKVTTQVFDLTCRRKISDESYSMVSTFLKDGAIEKAESVLPKENTTEIKKLSSIFSHIKSLMQKLKNTISDCVHFFLNPKKKQEKTISHSEVETGRENSEIIYRSRG